MEKVEKEFNPKVSIIIPIYNGANYMREAIDSAINQTYKNIEIIVVNDGSTDDTEKIAKSYGDKIKYFYKENGGVATALNLAIEKSEGEYISWLSHDDVYYLDKINTQIDCIRDDREVFVVYSNVEYIDKNSKLISKTSYENFHDIKKINSGLYPVIKGLTNGCVLLINKKCFDDVGIFDEKLKTSNDYDMWFRIFRKYKIKFLPKVLIKYRLHKNQGTKTNDIYSQESNQLWINFMKQISFDEISKIEESVYKFYFKLAEQMKNSSFLEAYSFAIKLAEKNNSNKTPKLSVIMPCYNTEKYLLESIESILNQTFSNFEFIIIDDGSTDNSFDIINEYSKKDSRIVVIKNKKNQGISKTMNIGLTIAKGEYITRMDSDDISLPERFLKQVTFLDRNKNYGLCSINISSIDDNGRKISESLFNKNKAPLEWLFLWLNPISNAPAMYRKEIIKKYFITYNNNFKTAEDYDFLSQIIPHTKIYQIDEVLYKYRIHSKSIFQKNIKKTCANSINISENFAKLLTGKNPPMFHKYLTVFSVFFKKESKIYNINEISCWLNELLTSAKSKWGWNQKDFDSAVFDAEARLINYSMDINDKTIKNIKNNFKKLFELIKDNKYGEIKNAIKNRIYGIPRIGKITYKMHFILKFLISKLFDLKIEVNLLVFYLKCKREFLFKNKKNKKILFIAMIDSIHTARWISQFTNESNLEIHLFPSDSQNTHSLIKNNPRIIVHKYVSNLDKRFNRTSHILERVIRYLKPDIVHTLEMQHAAYQILPIKQKMGEKFPLWFYSCWGSDIKWFEQFPEHKEKITQVLNLCDAFFCEDEQTIKRAVDYYNFKKPILKVHAVGGFDINYYKKMFDFIPPSKRKYIVIKGYTGWVYKPETIFEAIKLNYRDIINNKIKIIIYLPGDIQSYINELYLLGLDIQIFESTQDYDRVIELFSKARANISANLSDGIPTSMLEGMQMGSFPIQSFSKISTSTNEYIINGKNGFLLDPMDIKGYAKAINKVIVDGDLLDRAAIYNLKLISDRLEYDMIRDKVLKFYEKFLEK